MHTFKSVIEKLGPGAQMVGGSVIVLQDNKHVLVGRVAPETGSFVLTPAGLALMNAPEAAEEPVDKPVVAKGAAKVKAPARRTASVEIPPMVDAVSDAGDLSGDLGDISFDE